MLALVSCCFMTLAMGTLHSWSVFSFDLEQTLSISRTQSSLVYSVTLVVLTLTVLFSVPLFSRIKPWILFAGSLALAGFGLIIAASGSVALLFIGYGGLFGIANGIGYGFALQLSARVMSHRSGFAMGVTTAAYALGATVGAQVLGDLVEIHGSLLTIRIHGISFLLLAPLMAVLIRASKAVYQLEATQPHESQSSSPAPIVIDGLLINRYRVSYGFAVFAGLMAIAHATPFIQSFSPVLPELAQGSYGGDGMVNIALWGAMILGIGNAIGGVVSGLASDKYSAKTIVSVLPIVAALALACAAFSPNASIALGALAVIGFTYGALIAVYPVAIARQFGQAASATAYGRIFITWGIAGLLAPVVAGILFDVTRNYRYSMLIAMVISLVSAVAARRLK